MPTNKNLGVIGGLLVRNAILVGDATRHLARFEIPIPELARKSDHDQSLRWWIAVTARPKWIGPANGFRQSIPFSIKINRTSFAVIPIQNCQCRDAHGKGRWSVKNDSSLPTTDASAIQAVTPSDIFSWPGPDA